MSAAASAGGVPVDVDRSAVAAELSQLETEAAASEPPAPGAAPATEGAAPTLSIEDKAAQWAQPMRGAVKAMANIFAPNWELSEAECNGLGDALAMVGAHWMPDTQLPPKYVALVALGMSLVGVAGARFDQDAGKLKPLRKARAAEAAPATASATAPAPVGHQSAPKEI